VAATAETSGLMSTQEFKAMKRTATLVNVARGKIVNTDALVSALKNGEIAKAALDVTEPEPLPRGHPLLAMHNVVLSPHLGTAERGTRHRMMTMAVSNLQAGLAKENMPHPVPETTPISVSLPSNNKQTEAEQSSRLRLVVGNKAYSSWSLRAWLVCRVACGKEGFEEKVVPLAAPGSTGQKDVLMQYSPSGKVPALTDKHMNGLIIWDSLAIAEYVAELYPQECLWPSDARARALARSAVCEIHSGHESLKAELPTNCRMPPLDIEVGQHAAFRKPGVASDVGRICKLLETCLNCKWREEGDFLFGRFGIVDAMFAPTALAFLTFKPLLSLSAKQYCNTIRNMPEMKEWINSAMSETWHIDAYENR